MKDPVTEQRIELLHPLLRGSVKMAYAEICAALSGKAICRFAYTLRTFNEQNALYAQGRTKPGKICTKAIGGKSFHNYGFALDVVLLKDTNGDGKFETASWETNVDFDGDGKADWQEVVTILKQHGFSYGGDWASFPDMPHFEKSFGYSVNDLLTLYNSGKFDSNGYLIINT